MGLMGYFVARAEHHVRGNVVATAHRRAGKAEIRECAVNWVKNGAVSMANVGL
jgi:hypothetical protein